jgi:hypothetical protein
MRETISSGSGERSASGIRMLSLTAVFPVLMGAGCDLFATREPVLSEGASSLWQPPTSPNIIVQNLEVAFEKAIFNDYRRALTEDFTFEPDDTDRFQIDEIERPGDGAYDGWTRDVESATAEAISGSADSLSLDLMLFEEIVESIGRQLKYDYVLTLHQGSSVAHYIGEAWLRIRQESSGEWFIYEWKDVKSSPDDDSWGLLKGRNRLL